jgi:hypothetical protein
MHEKIAAVVFKEGEPMNWDLRTYQHEGDRSHTHELVVASAWTVMFVLLVAASVLDPAYQANRDGTNEPLSIDESNDLGDHHLSERDPMLVSTLRFPMRVPPSYCGSRILLCVVLSISVAAFFLIYDRVTLRGTPSVSDSLKPQTIVARPNPIRGYGSFNEPAAPDMNSSEVKFAGADSSGLRRELYSGVRHVQAVLIP